MGPSKIDIGHKDNIKIQAKQHKLSFYTYSQTYIFTNFLDACTCGENGKCLEEGGCECNPGYIENGDGECVGKYIDHVYLLSDYRVAVNAKTRVNGNIWKFQIIDDPN